MPDTEQAPQRRGREGGRWINERPSSSDFAEWFTSSMKLDANLRHEDYIGGVVLIPAVDERAKMVTGFSRSGEPVIEQRAELSYIPYAKVETRVAYYWDLLDAHPEWVGVVENVPSPRLPIDPTREGLEVTTEGGVRRESQKLRYAGAMTQMVHQLPEGFSIVTVPVGSAYSHFLCATIRVSIYDRQEYTKSPRLAVPLRTGRGTKQVQLLMGRNTPYADPNSLMKAETGALGRALGFAGIFVIPGSGVATAEDMLESMAQGATPAEAPVPDVANAGPAAPEQAPVRTGAEQQVEDDTQLRARAGQIYRKLSEDSPERATQFGEWMKERKHADFATVHGPALRGVVRKLEKLSEDAQESAQQAPSPEVQGGLPSPTPS